MLEGGGVERKFWGHTSFVDFLFLIQNLSFTSVVAAKVLALLLTRDLQDLLSSLVENIGSCQITKFKQW